MTQGHQKVLQGPPVKLMNLNELKKNSLEELGKTAAGLGLTDTDDLGKSELILSILRTHTKTGGTVASSGTLEILGDGFGFLRASKSDYSPSPEDIYVSPSQIRRFHLNTGDDVAGQVRPPKESERYFALLRVETINGLSTDKAKTSQGFTERKAITSDTRLSVPDSDIRARLFDLLCPIGKGQRTLIYTPARCKGGELLLSLAKAFHSKGEVELMSLLVAERPEFVTEYQSAGVGEVVASTFEEPVQRHTQITDVVVENAKRSADSGKDVVVLIDSLGRLASAASQGNPAAASSLPAGLSVKGLQAAKRLFAAGRNLQSAGSVTVVALLRDGESETDSYLRQELAPAANCELQLSAAAAALDCKLPLAADGFYNTDEGSIVDSKEREQLAKLRKRLAASSDFSALQELEDSLAKSKTNKDFLAKL
jgi:transcription termination factor Rho